MIFANPALLALLPLAVVPVVVHLLYKRRRATIELPSLWLLRNVELRLSPRRKLREYLLLAARCLFVAALALAVARPVSRGALGAGAVDYFVVLDNTASMQLQGAFDVATRRAHEVLDSMGAKDRAAILPTVAPDGWSADELTRDRAALRQALRSLVCSDAATDLEPAVENARALAEKATAPQAQVVVLSDYRGPAQRLSRGPVHVDCATPEAESNLALELISVEPAAPLVGRPVDVTVRIASDATDERVCAVGLELSGTPLETRSITVPAGGSTTTSLRIPRIPQVGWTRGRVALPDDGFAPDNAVAFVLKVRERIRAAVVDPDLADPESGGRFLTRLLDPSGDGTTSGIQARRLRPAEPPGEVEALLVCGYATAEGIALRAFAEGGGLVMVFAEEGDAGCDLDWLPAVPGGPVAYPDPTGRLLTVEDLTVVARLDLEARPEAEMLLRFDGRRP
ncbi:MAG: vWA domain-containing protein, partial [Planctomycetota bacterium]